MPPGRKNKEEAQDAQSCNQSGTDPESYKHPVGSGAIAGFPNHQSQRDHLHAHRHDQEPGGTDTDAAANVAAGFLQEHVGQDAYISGGIQAGDSAGNPIAGDAHQISSESCFSLAGQLN
jgi:hypothetical protein